MSRFLLSASVAFVAFAGTVHAQDQQAATPQTQAGRMPMFQALDTNNDGAVSQEEFIAGHRMGQAGYVPADANKDGAVSREEFIQAGQQRREARFKQLDTDGDGKLTQQEMANRATAMFRDMDANSDGKLTPEEMGRRGKGPGGGMGPGGMGPGTMQRQ